MKNLQSTIPPSGSGWKKAALRQRQSSDPKTPNQLSTTNLPRSMSVIAFHEKAGRSQVVSWFLLVKIGPLPSSRCRHASIRTLEERFVSLGACWAFSLQPVLPSVWRPVVLLLQSRTWARRLTQSPELGFGFCFSLPRDVFVFMLRSPAACPGYCAAVRTLLRSPTGDAATPPAFLQSPRWLASCRSSLHVPLVLGPSA